MGAYVVTTIAVKLESIARQFPVVFSQADNLDQALKTAEEWRPVGAQIDQNLIVRQVGSIVINNDRCHRCELVVSRAVGYKTQGGRGPQHAVQFLTGIRIRAERQHTQSS